MYLMRNIKMTHRQQQPINSFSNNFDIEMEPLVNEAPEEICHSSVQRNTNENVIKMKSIGVSNHCGLILAIISSLMFSLCSLLVKILNDISASELAMFRFLGVLLPSIPILIKSCEPCFPKEFRLILVVRSIAGTFSLFFQFYAFQHMPLADASVIIFSSPAFVAIFARIFLKESCGLFQIFLIFFTVAGVITISRPPMFFGNMSESYTLENWKGVGGALLGTVFSASVYVILRKLKSLHYSVILTNFATVALIITPSLSLGTGEFCMPECGLKRLLLVALGVLSFGGQFFLTKALQMEEAGPVALARTADVVFAFIWQFIFLAVVPDLLTIIGAFMVTFSIILLGLRRWIMSLPSTSSIRQRFSFFAF